MKKQVIPFLFFIFLLVNSSPCIFASDKKTIEKSASQQYNKGNLHRHFLGENYRDVWAAPVNVRIFDLKKEKGGLKVVKKGGGQQTLSLRLEAKDGKQYALRSLEKYTERSIPSILRKMFIAKLIQDQMSMTNPYACLVIPALAEAAGIYHTNPEIVYVPDDSAFGEYRKLVADALFLFEERPAGNWKKAAHFAHSKEIISTPDLLKEVKKDAKVKVDQKQVVLSRLFDMWINDRDRHDDQWRWARVKENGQEIYKPIPRDRDWAFFKNDGVAMNLASKKWISSNSMMWSLQGLDDEFTDIVGLNFINRFFDRTFLNEMEKQDWIECAEQIQHQMTDHIIENAFTVWPDTLYKLQAKDIIAKLKSRRDLLKKAAIEYYTSLAKIVDIPATDEKDEFLIERIDNNDTSIKIYRLSNKKMKRKELRYERIFKTSETSEIRLYGLDDMDIFTVKGNVSKGILIRIIGGKDEDRITDQSKVAGYKKMTWIYDDQHEENLIELGSEGSDHTKNNSTIHQYNRESFQYNSTIPVPFFGYNRDDGYFIGGGIAATHHGFQKEPYAQKHVIRMRYAIKTQAFRFGYRYKSNGELNDWGIGSAIKILSPSYVTNFYGLGNETHLENFDIHKNEEYNYVRMKKIFLNLAARHQLPGGEFQMGLFYQTLKIENNKDRFISNLQNNGLTSDIFHKKSHIGANFAIEVNKEPHTLVPNTGIEFQANALGFWGVNSHSPNFSRLESELKLNFNPFKNSQVATLFNLGGIMNWGEYDFMEMGSIGNDAHLKGYRRDRFRGDAVAYQNTELRLKIFHLNTYYIHGSFGMSAFHDIGRVWLEGESSEKWHQSAGGGIWFAPFDIITATMYYAISPEDQMITFQFNMDL